MAGYGIFMKKFLLVAMLLMLLLAMNFMPPAHAEDGKMYRTWMEPQNPVQGDTITIYYENPNATQVSIIVQSADGREAVMTSGHGKNGDVWWYRFSDMPAGDFVYKVNSKPINDSIPNDDNFHVLVKFHVEARSGFNPIEGQHVAKIYYIIAFILILVVVVISAAFLSKRTKNPEDTHMDGESEEKMPEEKNPPDSSEKT